MMKRYWVYLIIALPLTVFAQSESDARKFAETITTEDLFDHLSIVASDAFEGRETGTRGQKVAAAYIKAHFESLGLVGPVNSEYGNGYFQKVPLYTSVIDEAYISIGGTTYNNYEEVIYSGSSSMMEAADLEAVFVGEGSEDDLKGLDLNGKAAIVLADGWRGIFRGVGNRIQKAGAKLVIGVVTESDDDWNDLTARFSPSEGYGRLSLTEPEFSKDLSGIFLVSHNMVEPLTGKTISDLKSAVTDARTGKKNPYKKIRPVSIQAKSTVVSKLVMSENVLGYLEGTDKKEELVVLTAHYDHIGRRGENINNGADDDGSGTVTILELAEAFVEAKKNGVGPRRSILFMTVTGEEKGLRGSDYYTKNPVFPLENTVVNLNIDMIGRIDPQHADNENYVYLVGSDRLSSELHEISESINSNFTKLDLDYTYNDEAHPDRIYYRSDHWNFAKNNIPIIFYFTGIHDDYHRPSDTVDKIEFELLRKRANLVYYTAWALANREARVIVDKVKDTAVETR